MDIDIGVDAEVHLGECIHRCVYIYIYIHMLCVYICIYMYICIYIYIYTYIYIHYVHIYLDIDIYIKVHFGWSVGRCVYIYKYLYINKSKELFEQISWRQVYCLFTHESDVVFLHIKVSIKLTSENFHSRRFACGPAHF